MSTADMGWEGAGAGQEQSRAEGEQEQSRAGVGQDQCRSKNRATADCSKVCSVITLNLKRKKHPYTIGYSQNRGEFLAVFCLTNV